MWRMTDAHACAFLQLKAHKRGIEETEVTINMLLKRQNEDKVRLVLTTASSSSSQLLCHLRCEKRKW